ncbi:MAG: DUF72 domain-containing protein [Terriglobia bacterium]
MERATETVRVGPAGWSYPDWKGVVYPTQSWSGPQELEYLSQYFDTVEINTSFYRPLRPEIVRVWLRKIASNPRFRFTAKLLRRFTHERDAGRAEESEFKEGIAPLLEEGKLGALLLQFPWSFRNEKEERAYLAGLLARFSECPLVVEVRHASWNRTDALEFLRERGAGFCNIDQPVIGRSMPATAKVTAPVGYVRLHGRNYETWFAENPETGLRYNYLYTPDELREWKRRIEAVARQSETTFVILNNHYQGKAVVNALQLKQALGQEVVVPEPLHAAYPDLL